MSTNILTLSFHHKIIHFFKTFLTIVKSPFLPLFLLVMIDHIGHGIFFPILVPVFMEGDGILGPHVSPFMQSFWYNVTLSIFPIMLYFGATLMGGLSDRFGRKKILVICLIGASLSYLVAGIAIILKNLPLLLMSRAMAGFTSGTMPIAQAAVVDLSSEKNSAQNLGLLIFAGSLGFLVGPLLSGVCSDSSIISWFSYSTPFFIAALLGLINLVLLLLVFKETFVPKITQSLGLKKCLEFAIAPFVVEKIRFLSLIFLLLQLGWSFYFQFISIFLLKKYQYGSQNISLSMSMMGIGFALGSTWLLRVTAKYFSDKLTAIGTLGIATFCIFCTTLDCGELFNWIFPFFIGATMAALYSLMIKFYSTAVSREEQGWAMGVSEAMVSIAWGTTPLISTYLENWALALPLQVATAILVVTILLLQLWKFPAWRDAKNIN